MNIILFGGRPEPEAQPVEAAGPLVDFLRGLPVEMTAELGRALYDEFSAQELFRQKLNTTMRDAVRELMKVSDKLQADLQVPYRESEQYDAGYRAGRYAQATECAQLVQNAINKAMGVLGE